MTNPTFLPPSSFDNFASESISIPEDPEEMKEFLKATLESHARFLNRKDTGQYDEFEVQVNQTFPGASPQEKREIFRTVIDFGALPNTAAKSVAHNISNFSSVIFTRIYGISTQPGVQAFPIPLASTAFANQVEIFVDSSDVIITTGGDRSALTDTWVVLEYYRT
ncbi:MAG: hypothetical protein ACE5GV_00400 [Candidatus Scalindua sp.]